MTDTKLQWPTLTFPPVNLLTINRNGSTPLQPTLHDKIDGFTVAQQTKEKRLEYIEGMLKRGQTLAWHEYDWYIKNKSYPSLIEYIQGTQK